VDALVGQCAGTCVILDRDLEREFEERLKDSSALAFRLAYAVLGNREDAEEVAQEAFLKAYQNFQSLRDRTRFRAWSLREMFEIFSSLEYLLERECENLSGGEMQMVAIARALLGGPGLVLFDEPSQGLAPRNVEAVMGTIRRLRGEGISVLLVEQNARTALQVADRAYVMDRGSIVHEWPARALLADDAQRKRLLGV